MDRRLSQIGRNSAIPHALQATSCSRKETCSSRAPARRCGARHSDTVLVTDEGAEILTYYPRDLASLIIPV